MGLVVTVVVVLFALLVVLAGYVSFTSARLDRLYGRLDAAYAALDAQLVRRAAAAEALSRGELGESVDEVRRLARRAREAPASQREGVENDLSRALHRRGLDPYAPGLGELADAAVRVGLARQFYNDAVRDTRALRARPFPRLLRLGERRPLPAYFEIDDSGLAVAAGQAKERAERRAEGQAEGSAGAEQGGSLPTMDGRIPDPRERS